MSQFETLVKVLANSRKIQHAVIGQGIWRFYYHTDGATAMTMRQMDARALFAIVQQIKADNDTDSISTVQNWCERHHLNSAVIARF